MSDADDGADQKRVLTGFMVVLAAFGLGMFLLQEYLLAGVTFLGLTFVIYLRETW